MHLSRSNTSRSKSRSPAPPIFQSPRQYFPPSHFAAAGGFVLPNQDRVERANSSFSEDHSQDAYMPISYLSSASSDPSSLEYNNSHCITEPRSRKSSAESSMKKRESQMHNLPLVEAQLLPSLRDTIDKMTRPPSRMTISTPTIKLSRQNGSEDYGSCGGGSIDVSPYPSPLPRLKPPSTHTPMTYDAGEDRCTTPKRTTTPKTGSVLKSALKAPTPKLSASPSPTPAQTSSPGGGALRSVRSLLRRKSSSPTAPTVSSVSDAQVTKENQPAITFDVHRQMNARSRSRTDPGTFVTAANTLTAQSNHSSTSKTHQTPHTSHIPRFRGGTFTPGTARQFVKSHKNDANASTDESDLEYRYEVEGRDRRKLTVTNAVVVPSSSSESEDDPSFHLHPRFHTYGYSQRLPGRSKPGQGQEGKIGLGLMFTNQNRSGQHEPDCIQIYHEDHTYEHINVSTEAPHSVCDTVPKRQSRSSIASYPSAGSIYTDDEEAEFSDTTGTGTGIARSNQSLDLNELDETHSRRKAALLGLVKGLDNFSLQSSSGCAGDINRHMGAPGLGAEISSGRSILSEGESDYCGEKGLAVSGSLGEEANGLNDRDQEVSESDYGLEGKEDPGAMKQQFQRIRSATNPSVTPTPPAPVPSTSRRSSRYSSPSEPTVGKGVPNEPEFDRALSSKRHSLHPASAISNSPSPVPPGRYNHIPPSPRLPTTSKSKDKSSANIGGSLHYSRIPHAPIPSEKDQKLISKRKSYTRDLSLSPLPLSPTTSTATPYCRSSPTPSTVKRESHNSYESVVLAKRSMEAVVRTRQAFGIPPSESDAIYHPSVVNDQVPDKENNDIDMSLQSMLPPADSMASGVDVAMERSSWEHEVDNELSVGAENLFRTLSQGGGEARGRSHQAPEDRKNQRYEPQQQRHLISSTGEEHFERSEKSRSRERRQPRHRSRTPVARSSLTQRTMDSENFKKPSIPSSWRSMVGPDMYMSLLEAHGEVEVQRQEVIWELRTQETVFVERLFSVVSLFIIPLRVHATKSWIAGVPLEIAKVLDWLEDIVNLHTEIRDTLQLSQTPECPLAGVSEAEDRGGTRVAYALRSFVPRLEIYQPYLVKLSNVSEMLRRLVKDSESDFGEFVRIQEKTLERRVSFANMLLEPAERIATYPDLFRKLLNVTPKNHEEYLATVMLVHSTSLVIKTLQTVKAREEEYEFIKSISERIDGLPATTNLARRDRRLLCHGELLCLNLNQTPRNSDPRRASDVKMNNTTNRLVDAINDWDTRRSRSGSVKSNNSASTGVSFRSVETSSPPPPPQLSVLVFSDLVVFATTRLSSRENSNQIHQEQQGSERWTLCGDIGVARVLGVEEASNGDDAEDLLPVKFDLSQSSSCTGTRVKTVQLQLPLTVTSNPSCKSWISAFELSSQSTFRNLSTQGLTQTTGDIEGPNRLLEQDRRRILESILDTGLPLPKSPSAQLIEDAMGRSSFDSTEMEREERGWWSLQFQQLLRENWYGKTS
ncbi:hypothetical protein HHX47_DHR2000034 [Lentinula edodes]|nr:hypothetical protein HHX47_DHR2000034 [Lentinula edodes]